MEEKWTSIVTVLYYLYFCVSSVFHERENKALVKFHNVCSGACTFLNSFAMFWRSKENYPKCKTLYLNLLNGKQNPYHGKRVFSRVFIRFPMICEDVMVLWMLGRFGEDDATLLAVRMATQISLGRIQLCLNTSKINGEHRIS